MTVTSDHSVRFEWDLVQNNHQSILYKKCGNLASFELIETAKKAAQGNRSWNTYYYLHEF